MVGFSWLGLGVTDGSESVRIDDDGRGAWHLG